MAWAKPSQGQAVVDGFGLAQDFRRPKPPQARPKPWLSGQAGPEYHYVACQWHKNFLARVEKSPGLFLPDDLQVVPAVGKFHLSAHRASCFSRFSLMFLKGAGHIDGEVLETLWASFNKISPSARSMTLAHHQELYDDHMRDSNWKKLVGIGK